MQQQSLGGAKCYVCFKDNFTKYHWVFFRQYKNEVSKCLETFLNQEKNAGHMVKEAEAVNTSVYVLNRTEPTSIKDKSPYELWFSKEVINIDPLHVFGIECFVHVPQQKRRKWDKKSVKGVFVRYSGEKDGYRIWIKDQNKVILSRDVIFQKEKSSCVPDVSSSDIQYSDTEIVKKPLQTPDLDVEKEIEEICSAEDTEETLAQQSSRNSRDRSILKMPDKFDGFVILAE
ncbi:retrovirus-related Pol polyprotein from transposon TNT 1-94 [Nephila pilipes]|uniref:Retrovirus-related Pol polyprotein from transposon TNT 1-94 n=1 Tax=Nephila pilipes TaxID=299642 RepID=A0A8X6R1F1_NEPPI|nr:retrovirus-related Pol polyprotein from transposon TNT 1-94 [Nephila pilipes]